MKNKFIRFPAVAFNYYAEELALKLKQREAEKKEYRLTRKQTNGRYHIVNEVDGDVLCNKVRKYDSMYQVMRYAKTARSTLEELYDYLQSRDVENMCPACQKKLDTLCIKVIREGVKNVDYVED